MPDNTNLAPITQAGANSTTASTFDLKSSIEAQQKMFQQSMEVNQAQSELQTWGNLAESVAKAKPQV